MHKNIKLIAWFNFFTDFSFFAPVAIIYFSNVAGSYALGASVFSVAMLSSAIFEVPTGVFSDHIGRRKTMVLGAVAASLGVLFYAIGGNYFFLVAGAILNGLSRALYSGNNNALLYDTLKETGSQESFDDYMGKTHSLFQAALAVSAATGSIIASYSFPLAVWLTLIPQAAAVIVALMITEPKVYKKTASNIYKHLGSALKKFRSNRKLRLLSASHVLKFSLSESSYQFKAAFVQTVWPIWAIGFASVLSNIGATASYFFSGKFIKRFKELKTLLIGTTYGKLASITALVFPSAWSPAIMSTTSIFFGVQHVAKETLMQKEFSEEERATMSSLNSLFASVGFAIASFLLGFYADIVGPTKALLTATILGIPVIFIYLRLFREDKAEK